MKRTPGNLHRLPDGRYVVDIRTRVDLGIVSKDEAEHARAQLTPPPAADSDGQIKWHEAAITRIRAQLGEAVPLSDIWANYESRAGQGNASTTGAYQQRWANVLKWAELHGIVTLGQLNDRIIDQMALELREKYTGTTLNGIMASAKVVVDATVGRHGRNPFKAHSPVKATGRDHRPFTTAEIDMILSRATDEILTACMLMLYTGQRAGDVGSWEWSRVDFARGVLWCRQQKTGRRIELPMHAQLATHLWNVKADQVPVRAHIMPRLAENQGKRKNATAHEINRFLKKQGFVSTEDGIVGSHSFRYSFVTIMRSIGVSDSIVMELVGHSTKCMLDHYSRVGLDAKAGAVALLPAFGTGGNEGEG